MANRKYLTIPTQDIDEGAFWEQVNAAGVCWEWTGALARGYGLLGVRGRQYRAHRIAYTLLVGPIPSGLDIDHLCRNTRCVNPDHLEPVETRVNTLRGYGAHALNARKNVCAHGHSLSGDNIRWKQGRRSCRTCYEEYHRNYAREHYRANREREAARARDYRSRNREEVNRRAREKRRRAKEAA